MNRQVCDRIDRIRWFRIWIGLGLSVWMGLVLQCDRLPGQEVESVRDEVVRRSGADKLNAEGIGTVPPVDVADDVEQIARAKDLAEAFRIASSRVLPTVVTVLASSRDPQGALESLQFLDDSQRFESIGSGVILDSKGLIVTNAHVVQDARQVLVRLEDGREFQGRDVKADPKSDSAILYIDCPDPLASVSMGDSDRLAVGDWVLAIGSPFNIEQTVSAGIISGKARVLQGLVGGQLLQTDAAINPGNSGGALVDLNGQLVGMNTAIASKTGAFQGIGFAIPSNRLQWLVSELVTHGLVRRARMGVTTNQIPQELAEQLKIPVRGGVYVTRLVKDGPAAHAGIATGDIIVEIANQKVRTPADFASVVEQLPIGQPQMVKFIRDGAHREAEVSLVERK
jgi:serine protease Do